MSTCDLYMYREIDNTLCMYIYIYIHTVHICYRESVGLEGEGNDVRGLGRPGDHGDGLYMKYYRYYYY